MGVISAHKKLEKIISAAKDLQELDLAMAAITRVIGCDYYAVGHHVAWGPNEPHAFRLQNYPAQWVDFYDSNRCRARDPVHRVSGRTQKPFLWREASDYIELTGNDERFMDLAGRNGLGDGFTVPSNVPGEFQGSCTFAVAPGRTLNEDGLYLARLIGPDIFHAARKLVGMAQLVERMETSHLTERQRDCLLWIAAGKSDWETGVILGISEETVKQHINDACKRMGIRKRTLLLFLAFRNGAISISEVPYR
jgi:LuxR family quorum-sensing system transcriptional regulator CciR